MEGDPIAGDYSDGPFVAVRVYPSYHTYEGYLTYEVDAIDATGNGSQGNHLDSPGACD